jgi:Sec-independent protein translocase protein TatA
MAGDLNETQSATNVVFGESAKVITDFSKRAAKELGLSQLAAQEAAQTFGGLAAAAGKTGPDVANFAMEMTKLSADMASFKNTTPEDAIQAIGAALRGEMEPIRRYNVLLDDATLRNRALQMGLIDSVKTALTPANKTLAAQAEILAQTSIMHDDFSRTSGGAAGQQKILKAEIDNAVRSLGQALVPVLETILPLLVSMAGWVGDNAGLVGALTVAFGLFAGAIVVANAAMSIWRGIAIVTTAVNWALATSFTAVQVSTGVGIATAFAAAAAFVVITKKMKGAAGAANSLGGSLGTLAGALVATGTSTDANTNAEIEAAKASAKLTIAKSKAAEAARKLKNALKEAKSALRDDFNKALEAAQQKLESAQDAFTKFASSVSDALTSSLNFQDAYDAGKDTGSGFIAGLTEQAAKIKNFGVLVNRLIAGGLSEAALTKVLDAGVDAGTAIAEELLNGADNILRANELVAEVQGIADLVGKNSATKFYEAGVIAGQNLVAGVQAAINSFEIRLNTPGLTTEDINAMRGEFGVALTGPAIPFDLEDFNATFNANFGNFLGNVPMFADGGIVNSPTLGIIGESGPEAVIPLDRIGDMGGGINITVNAGLVSTPDQIGQEIIQAIQKAQRRSGPVFAPA